MTDHTLTSGGPAEPGMVPFFDKCVLRDGRRLRALNLFDQLLQECRATFIDLKPNSMDVPGVLKSQFMPREVQKRIRSGIWPDIVFSADLT